MRRIRLLYYFWDIGIQLLWLRKIAKIASIAHIDNAYKGGYIYACNSTDENSIMFALWSDCEKRFTLSKGSSAFLVAQRGTPDWLRNFDFLAPCGRLGSPSHWFQKRTDPIRAMPTSVPFELSCCKLLCSSLISWWCAILLLRFESDQQLPHAKDNYTRFGIPTLISVGSPSESSTA